jgi:hypothetical protein
MPPQPRKATAKTGAKKSTSSRKSATAGPTASKTSTKKASTRKTSASKTSASAASAASTAGMRAAAAEGVEETLERIRGLQERLLQVTKQNGEAYLDAYEKNLSSMLALTEKAAKSTNLDWAVTLAANYADFVKRINSAVIQASRSALR